MPVSELGHRFSAYEVEVLWPAYYEAKQRRQRKAETAAKTAGG